MNPIKELQFYIIQLFVQTMLVKINTSTQEEILISNAHATGYLLLLIMFFCSIHVLLAILLL